MKKYLIILSMFLLLCGCGKTSNENIIKNFKNKIEKNNSYILKGTMTITSNEDTFTYKVEASKSKDDYYKVSLINKTNDHEQIILKNSDGIYVVTPELNKSFKFQSDWPNNGSQSYLLDILVNDVVNDKEVHIDRSGENKYIQCKVNYPNNKTLYSEKIYLDNNYGVKKVEVLNQDGKVKISLEVSSINYKPKFDKTFFDLNKLIKEDNEEINENNNENKSQKSKDNNKTNNTSPNENIKNNDTNENKEQNTTNNDNNNTNNNENNNTNNEEKNTSKLDDIIYPLYIPTNTYLSTQDTINTDNGNRAILTFSGDSPFILVEEVSRKYDYLEVIPINGDPLMMSDSIGAISANSLYWTSNGIDYYISSTKLNGSELMTIAEGLTGSSVIVSKEK